MGWSVRDKALSTRSCLGVLMGRPLSPCGTPAAYRRHLREGSDPCAACRRAKADEKAGRGDPIAVTAAGSGPAVSPLADLENTRVTLIEALKVAEVSQVPSLTRELRATLKDIAALREAADAGGAVVVDEFTAAREARAARTAGA